MTQDAGEATAKPTPRPRVALGRPARFARADGIAAAIAILTEEGPAQLSVRKVADLLGASRQVVYTLFGSQLGLVDALYQEGFIRLRRRLDLVEGPAGPEHIVALGHAYRANALQNPELYGIMFERPFPRFSPSEESMELAVSAFEPLAAAVAALRDAPADPWDRALALWAAIHGIVHLELQGYLTRLSPGLDSEEAEQGWFDARLRALVQGPVQPAEPASG